MLLTLRIDWVYIVDVDVYGTSGFLDRSISIIFFLIVKTFGFSDNDNSALTKDEGLSDQLDPVILSLKNTITLRNMQRNMEWWRREASCYACQFRPCAQLQTIG